ncbi:histidinol-phosphate transaminase [Bacillota bacterium]
MTYRINNKLKALETYPVETEEFSIRLDANESFINPGFELRDKLMEAWGTIPLNRYPDDSYSELKKAAGAYYGVDPELLVVGNGSDELLSIIVGSFMKSDDILVLAEPDFSMYKVFASTFERNTVSVNRTDDGTPDYSTFLKVAGEKKANAILLSNPSAACSTLAPAEDLLEFIDNTDMLVIVDEAYMDFSDQSLMKAAVDRDNLIVLRTCSKAFGCAGIRLGFAASSEKLAGILNALRPPYNLNAFTAEAGRIVLSEPDYIRNSVDEIIKNRNTLYHLLKSREFEPAIGNIYPSATNFICVETEFAEEIYRELKKRSILVRYINKMLRITVGTKEENYAVVEAIGEIVREESVKRRDGK